MKPRFIFLALLIFACTFLWGETIEPFVIPQARFAGLGGRHAAAGDSFYAIFTNPAAFVDIEQQFSAAEISLSTYGPVFEIIDLIRNNSGSLDDLDLSGILGNRGFAAGFDLAGPLSLGWVGHGLGLGIFNRIKTDLVISGLNLKPGILGDILLVGGYSYRFLNLEKHHLDGGFLGKGFLRGDLGLNVSILEIASLLDDFGSKPFKTDLGMGLDLGVRYTYRENLALALVCYDIYSPVLVTNFDALSDFGSSGGSSGHSYATVYRSLDLGVKYRIRSPFLDRFISNFSVMADYRDFLDLFSMIPRNPILNVGLGMELTVLNALSFRFGISDAMPAFGIGLDLTFMTLDFAMHGRELGLDPGKHSVYGLDLGLIFRY